MSININLSEVNFEGVKNYLTDKASKVLAFCKPASQEFDPSQFTAPEFNVNSLTTREMAQSALDTCSQEKRIEQVKAIIKICVASIAILALISAAFAVAKGATLVLGVLALPLIILPPLYSIVSLFGGVACGCFFAQFTIEAVWKEIMNPGTAHWDRANLLDERMTQISAKLATL